MANEVHEQIEVIVGHLAVEDDLVLDVHVATGDLRPRAAFLDEHRRTTFERRAGRESVFLEHVIDVFPRDARFDGGVANISRLESIATHRVSIGVPPSSNRHWSRLDAGARL